MANTLKNLSFSAPDKTAKTARDRTLLNLRRRLEQWELDHLRKHAAELAERLEYAEELAERERQIAEDWWRTAMDLQSEVMAEGGQIGLTRDGRLVLMAPEQTEALLEAARAAESILAQQKWIDETAPEAIALAKLRAAISATEAA